MKRKDLINGAMTTAGLATAAGLVLWVSTAKASPPDESSALPETLTLTGVARDFRELSVPGGHPDFERRPDHGFGMYTGNINEMLDADGKPVANGQGHKVKNQWRDSSGRAINPSLYNAELGDTEGTYSSADNGGITLDRFFQWYRDVPGVNMSTPVSITLHRDADSNVYTFDDKEDDDFIAAGGFFPINGQLFGNSAGDNKNFHFTYQLSTEFVYSQNTG